MINLVIVGSIGLDDVETPYGKSQSALGGSTIYGASGASYFTKPGIVGIIGDDMPKDYQKFMKKFDCQGITKKGKTFRWSGFYEGDMNGAKTLDTQLNSFAEFEAILPEQYKQAQFLFLGNIQPELQMKVLDQMKNKPFVLMDTMNYWIESKKPELLKAIKKVDFLVINEGEARQLCETSNLIVAGRQLLKMGPKYIAIKKGEHGALLFSKDNFFSAGSFPLEKVKDPTGCGDSFAGALMGYLARTGDTSETNIRKAIIYGTAVASFCAEDFSLEYTKKIKLSDIKERYKKIKKNGKF